MDPKNPSKEERQEISRILSSEEKKAVTIAKWHDHVMMRDQIASFLVIASGQLYQYKPQGDDIFLPFEEDYEDHVINWIICWNMKAKKEIFRQNLATIDMIDWLRKE